MLSQNTHMADMRNDKNVLQVKIISSHYTGVLVKAPWQKKEIYRKITQAKCNV